MSPRDGWTRVVGGGVDLADGMRDEMTIDERGRAPLHCVDLYVGFDDAEDAAWRRTGAALGAALHQVAARRPLDVDDPARLLRRLARSAAEGDVAAAGALRLAHERSRIVRGADARRACATAVVGWLLEEGYRAVVFHESIAAAEEIADSIAGRGGRAVVDHEQRSPHDRAADVQRYREGQARVLVAVRPEEGADRLPAAPVAVVVSGSRSPRQRLARLEPAGRGEAGPGGLFITILVEGTPEESFVGGGDAELLGPERVAHHRWPATSVRDALVQPSTWTPRASVDSLADLLTASTLGAGGRVRLGAEEARRRPPAPEVDDLRIGHAG